MQPLVYFSRGGVLFLYVYPVRFLIPHQLMCLQRSFLRSSLCRGRIPASFARRSFILRHHKVVMYY